MTTTARPTTPTSPPPRADRHPAIHDSLHALRLIALLALVAGLLLPSLAPTAQAQDDGQGDQATITVTSLGPDGEAPLPFARFQVTDSLGTVYPARETAPPDGETTFTFDLVDDTVTYSVAEETPPACGVAPDPQEVGPLSDGDNEELEFTTTFLDDCDLGAVSVYSYTCPDGLDLSITDYAQYRDGCLATNDGATFTVAEAKGDQDWTLTTGAFGIPGRAPLVGLEPGDYLLTAEGDDAGRASLVYCLTYDGIPGDGTGPVSISQELPNAKGAVELKLDGGRIACDVFRVAGNLPANVGGDDAPNASGDQPSDAQAQDDSDIVDPPTGDDGDITEGDDQGTDAEGVADPASIEFHVAMCPTGYDGPDYFTTCSDAGLPNVTFTVIGQDTGTTKDSDPSVQPVTPGFGITTISGLPADTYSIGESIPGDFVDGVFIYCADAPGGGPRIQTSNGLPLAPGQDVICDYYVLPSNAQGNPPAILRLTAFTCAPGYTGTSFGEVTSDCADPTQGIAFNLSTEATQGSSAYDVDKTTNGDGKVRFTELPPSPAYVLDEDLPGDALDDRIAFCAVDGAPYVEYDASTGTIQLDPILNGQEIQCLWYVIPTDQDPATATPTATATPAATATSVPDESGSLRIHKSECPPGQRDDYYDDCYDDVVGGIGFNVRGPGAYDQTGTTSDQGIVTFEDVPAGNLVVTELQPGGYQVDLYVVVCSRDGQPFPITYDDSTGLRVDIALPSGADVVCDWYNVPPGPAPTATPDPTKNVGSITVVASLCELPVAEVVSFADDCDEYGDGADFTLTGVSSGSGPSGSGTTGTDSRLVFADLKPGAYALEETSLDWCKAQADSVDDTGNLVVTKGQNTNVYIYNCLPDGKPAPGQPGGSKTPIKTLPSTGTGTGPVAQTVEHGISLATWAAAAALALTVLAMAAVTPVLIRHRRRVE